MNRREKSREGTVEQVDVAIIGGGPGGLTAGIYCGRANLNTVIIEKAMVGGLATYTNEIENYPGFVNGITGNDLMKNFQDQAKRFNVKFKLTDVKSIQVEGPVKIVETARTRYEAKAVIVASGGKPRLTGAKGEENYLYDKGIAFCATCDAAANKDKVVMVIGSGDAAIEEGMFLTKFASKVIVSVIHDEGIMDCNEIAKAEALANPKMEFIWNTVVDEFKGEDHLDTIVLKNVKSGGLIPVTVDSCFLFIGYIPNSELFEGILDMTPTGYLLTNDKMETNIDGVFAVGDIREKFLRQVATAVGDGAMAGVAAEKYIAEEETFHTQIMESGAKTNLVYVYNCTDHGCLENLAILEKFEQEFSEHCKLIRVDIYKSNGIAKRLAIETAPTVAFIKDGCKVQILEGNLSRDLLLMGLSAEIKSN
ncbi:MAG TPA: FAD-dependent oxidoreductase [Candidatus Limnocylindrales bacterium]|nr:FAD-dependent oxidoreductase [Candidatus Limnocylindrales bacterium]